MEVLIDFSSANRSASRRRCSWVTGLTVCGF